MYNNTTLIGKRVTVQIRFANLARDPLISLLHNINYIEHPPSEATPMFNDPERAYVHTFNNIIC